MHEKERISKGFMEEVTLEPIKKSQIKVEMLGVLFYKVRIKSFIFRIMSQLKNNKY